MKVASQWMLQFHVFSFPRSSLEFVPGSIYQSRNGYSKAVFKMKKVVSQWMHQFGCSWIDVSKPEWLFKGSV
jgi:hypothetical protein